MTAESRKAIPGRSAAEDHSLDRLVFGDNNRDKPEQHRPEKQDKPAEARERDIKVRMRERSAANDDDADDAPADPVLVGDISFVERAAKDRRRSTDRRRSYSRLPDERGNFGSENSKRGPMLAAIALCVVLVFGALVWNMYRDGVKSETKSLKPKAIAGGSFKSMPEADAGGDVDGAQVFDQVGAAGSLDGGPTGPVVEPSPAVIAPPVAAAPKAEVKPAPAPSVAAPKAEVKPAAAPSPVAKVAPPPVAKPEPKPEPKVIAPKAAAPVVAAEPAAKPAAFTPAFAAGGAYVVQLAALTTEAEAETEWAKRAKSAPDLFGSAEKIVVKAEVNGKTVYRLRAGAFASAADAEAFCSAFKGRGGICFRAAR